MLGWGLLALGQAETLGDRETVGLSQHDYATAPDRSIRTAARGEQRDWDEGVLSALLCQPQYSWPCDWAIGVVYGNVACPWGESHGDPWAHGHGWYEGRLLHFIGLWQIAVETHEGNEWLYDPTLNTREANIKYVASGRAPWPVCGQ